MTVERVLSDPLDKLRFATPDAEEAFIEAVKFAMEHPYRMRSFFGVVNYLLNWGRGDQKQNPTSIVIGKDWTKHSFGWAIKTYRYDEEARAIVDGGGIFIMMYYREADQQWETHS